MTEIKELTKKKITELVEVAKELGICLLYTSDAADEEDSV